MTDQRNWLFVTGPVARKIECNWMLPLIALKMLCRSFCLPRPEGCQYTRWTICPILWHSIVVRVFTLIVRMIKTVRRYRMNSQLDMRSRVLSFSANEQKIWYWVKLICMLVAARYCDMRVVHQTRLWTSASFVLVPFYFTGSFEICVLLLHKGRVSSYPNLWNRALLGKLIVVQPVNFSTAFGTWRLFTVLTRAQNWSLNHVSSFHSFQPYLFKAHFILCCLLLPWLTVVVFLQGSVGYCLLYTYVMDIYKRQIYRR